MDATIRGKLEDFMNNNNLTKRELASALACSDTIVYHYFSGKGSKKFEKKLSTFLSESEERLEKKTDVAKVGFASVNKESNNQELIKMLKELMEMKGVSANHLAKSLAISPAALSQWLSSKYKGDVEKINESVKAYLIRQAEIIKVAKKEIRFVETSVSERVFEVARLCHLDGEIGVVYGPAGVGKTAAVKEYVKRNPGTVLIEADLGYTSRYLFRDITKALGVADGYHSQISLNIMFEDTIEAMKGTDRMIIIDEAEMLPYKALEMIRRVNDKAGVGILLAGMPRLINNIRGKKGEYAQLYSRIGYAIKLETLQPQDTFELVKQIVPNGDKLYKKYHTASYGNTRILSKLLYRSIRVAQLNNIEIDEDVIEETAKILIRK